MHPTEVAFEIFHEDKFNSLCIDVLKSIPMNYRSMGSFFGSLYLLTLLNIIKLTYIFYRFKSLFLTEYSMNTIHNLIAGLHKRI